MNVAVVVGNPKPRSRTYQACQLVAERICGKQPDLSIDLVDLGPKLLDWSDPEVAEVVADICTVDTLIVGSPTFKATYSGLLKLFLDRIASGALAGVTAVPVMLGGEARHALAADMLLKPVLIELGATCPTRGLFLLEEESGGSPDLDTWIAIAQNQVRATSGSLR